MLFRVSVFLYMMQSVNQNKINFTCNMHRVMYLYFVPAVRCIIAVFLMPSKVQL